MSTYYPLRQGLVKSPVLPFRTHAGRGATLLRMDFKNLQGRRLHHEKYKGKPVRGTVSRITVTPPLLSTGPSCSEVPRDPQGRASLRGGFPSQPAKFAVPGGRAVDAPSTDTSSHNEQTWLGKPGQCLHINIITIIIPPGSTSGGC